MIVGIDVGSQSLKAVLLDDRLRPAGSGRRSYPIDFPQPGWAEQSPAVWEEAFGPAIAEALAAAGRKPGDVTAIGIAGQLDGCIAVDGSGAALAPIWMAAIWRRRPAGCCPMHLLARDRCASISP